MHGRYNFSFGDGDIFPAVCLLSPCLLLGKTNGLLRVICSGRHLAGQAGQIKLLWPLQFYSSLHNNNTHARTKSAVNTAAPRRCHFLNLYKIHLVPCFLTGSRSQSKLFDFLQKDLAHSKSNCCVCVCV